MSNTTGELIRLMRKSKGVTLEKLAQELKVSASAVSQYERGIITPSSETLIRIARALKCPVREIASSKDMAGVSTLFADAAANNTVGDFVSNDEFQQLYPSAQDQNDVDAVDSVLIDDIWDAGKDPDPALLAVIKRAVRRTIEQMRPPKKTSWSPSSQRVFEDKDLHYDNPADPIRFYMYFDKLNEEGWARAFDYMEELTQIPRYQRKNDDKNVQET